MAFSLSELLNPAPSSAIDASDLAGSPKMDSAEPPSAFFAPELFHPPDDATIPQDAFETRAQDEDIIMDDGHDPEGHISFDLQDEERVKLEALDTAYPPLDDEPLPHDTSILDMVDESFQAEDASTTESPEKRAKSKKAPGRPRKSDADIHNRSTVHSSKNEGQHTDRRYLCYLCNKLFTRRRSVRDHISKIHNTKTWEPVRSLEVIVDPISGEPIESIEDVIARGPPPPPPKPSKVERAAKALKHEREDEGEDDDEQKGEDEDGLEKEEARQRSAPAPPPLESSPAPSATVATLKKEPSIAGSRASSTEPFAVPAPLAGKKRPAPDDPGKPLSTAAKKKGMAKVKSSASSNKRIKVSESEQSSPAARPTFRSPSAAPASTQLKPIPSKLKKQTSAASASPTPVSSRAVSLEARSRSSSVAETPSSSNDDGEVFCICRKGDNHTWMIACDGGCDEWFHGNCVNIRERDGELIDKYICPTCMRPGLQTTWKRMCRRRDCRKPARVMQDPPSKYCSDACGRMFFVELVQRGDSHAQASKDGQYVVEAPRPKKHRKKQSRKEERSKPSKTAHDLVNGDLINPDSRLATPAYSDEEKSDYETDSSLDDEMLPNRGAALRAGEVKALLEKCRGVETWRMLGRKPDTPPRDVDGGADAKPVPLEYDDLEGSKLASIAAEKQQLTRRSDMLDARETFLELVKARSAAITEEVRKTHPKMKDLCGFDPRMSWCDEEFAVWYNERGGKEILAAGSATAKIGPPEDLDLAGEGNDKGDKGDKDDAEEEDADAASDTMPKKGGVCVKNRCPRHRNWAKGQLAEVKFEQDLVRRAISRCEAQEDEIRAQGVIRAWEKRGQNPVTTAPAA